MTPQPHNQAHAPGDAEPEVTNEESIPSDGKDEVGEKMMEDLGRKRGVEQTQHPGPSKD